MYKAVLPKKKTLKFTMNPDHLAEHFAELVAEIRDYAEKTGDRMLFYQAELLALSLEKKQK
jgi:hypothetical protein